MRGVLGVVVVAGAVLVAPVGGMAQQAIPVEAKPRTLQEDSLAALRALDRAVRTNQHDAAAWHERGVVAWRMSGAEKRTGYMKRLANDSLLQLADSSLSLAVSYAPNTPRYLIDLARFYLTSNSAAVRGRAHGLFKRALGLARTQPACIRCILRSGCAAHLDRGWPARVRPAPLGCVPRRTG